MEQQAGKAKANGLFDKRYRYNYIYPRGRSGETLRAVDSQNENRPVVIKRPNPNDAPPIRAGQEVSIIKEREALTRLAGHPVLAELLGSGQFFAGGIPQQYIVIERAEGLIIADEVLRLAAQNQRLPALEMLEIVGRLIDLLRAAHKKDIVYNDVDAKHLFWDRETYRLKVIDWGNAVFLEGDEAAKGVSPQTDIYQLGELLYFIVSGGYRADVPRDADYRFQLAFPEEAGDLDPRLHAVITRAVHPNLRYRYASLAEMSADLARYRSPLEHSRDTVLQWAADKLQQEELSHTELQTLQRKVQGALDQDPAYPAARKLHHDIIDRLGDLEIAADLDAVKIYMQGSNWTKAAELLAELRERAGSKTSSLVHLLLDWCRLLSEHLTQGAPPAVSQAVEQLFAYRADKAANLLLWTREESAAERELSSQLAERISAHFSEVLLLWPNLARIQRAIAQLDAEDIPITEAQSIAAGMRASLAQPAAVEGFHAVQQRERYRELVESLTALSTSLQALSRQHNFSERRLPLKSLGRAMNAAQALADAMHVIGRQAANSPRDALSALDASRAIDPPNPMWEYIEDRLSLLYDRLKQGQTFVPAADGANLEGWLGEKRRELQPFAEQLNDDMLRGMLENLQGAQAAWQKYRAVIVAGDRAAACEALASAEKAVATISPSLCSWFKQLRGQVEKARYVERHAVPGHLGRTLADGWEAFDRGQLADAQRLGLQAVEIARSEQEQQIAERLWRLARVLREWLERNGAQSDQRTHKALMEVEQLFSAPETRIIDGFAQQMPSTETYLKAMGQGLVQQFRRSNTAALRILFCQYILCGVLDAHDGDIADARFWQAAALRSLGDDAERHPAVQVLGDIINKRGSLLEAQTLFNEVSGARMADSIPQQLQKLKQNTEARALAPGIQSLQALDSALQDWSEAEFRSASKKLEQVLRGIADTEATVDIDLAAYRNWVSELQMALATLSAKRRSLLLELDRQPTEPQASIGDTIKQLADTTEELLGYQHARMMLDWRDSYVAIVTIYQSEKGRSQKLRAMDKHLQDMFIDRHPAYPLFRHWQRQVEALPAESEPEPEVPPERLEPAGEVPMAAALDEEAPQPLDAPSGERRWILRAGMALAILLVAGGLLALAQGGSLQQFIATLVGSAASEPAPAPDSDPETVGMPATSSEATTPSKTPTAVPSATATATSTSEPSPVPTAAPPSLPVAGAQDALALFTGALDEPFWDSAFFRREGEAWRLGSAEASREPTRLLTIPAEQMLRAYGAGAPQRLSRVEAEMSLHSANPELSSADELYFGIALQSADTGELVGIQVQQLEPRVIQIALRQNDRVTVISQRSVNNVIARLRLERDAPTGFVTAYFNDSLLGEPMTLEGGGALPALVVKGGRMIVGVASWSLRLDEKV